MPLNQVSAPIGSWIGTAFEALAHHVDDAVEIRTHDVHLIDISHARDMVFVRLAPHRFRLRLDAALGAEYGHRAVEHFQRALDLDGEVHVSGGVDDIDAVVLPITGGRGGGDRDATLLLLRHPVHCRRALVGLTDLVVDACVVQDTLGGRRLAGVNVGHYANVAG